MANTFVKYIGPSRWWRCPAAELVCISPRRRWQSLWFSRKFALLQEVSRPHKAEQESKESVLPDQTRLSSLKPKKLFSLIWKKTPCSDPSVVVFAKNKTKANRYTTWNSICQENLRTNFFYLVNVWKYKLPTCWENGRKIRKAENIYLRFSFMKNTARRSETFLNRSASLVLIVNLLILWSSSESVFLSLSGAI